MRKHAGSVVSALFTNADTIVAATIPLVAVSLLTEAYFRTTTADAQAPCDCQNAQSNRLIQKHHVRQLKANGIVVIPHFLSLAELAAARKDIWVLQQQQEEGGARCFSVSANSADVRQDLIQWIQEDPLVGFPDDRPSPIASVVVRRNNKQDATTATTTTTTIGTGLSRCIGLLRGIPHAIQQHDYYRDDNNNRDDTSQDQDGPPQLPPPHRRWKVPRQCQLALYPGNGQAAYQRHLDRCDRSFVELGLLEWWRLSDYRERCLTTILYLNEADRPLEEGGALRCWVAAAKKTRASTTTTTDDDDNIFGEPFDIQPRGGTLVIFQSGIVDHQVLPSTSDRLALTNWVGSIPN